MPNNERFSQISEKLAVSMSDLSINAKWLFALLLIGKVRNRWTGEPHKKEFEFSYLDFKQYGITRSSFDRGIKELSAKKYIRVSGTQRAKICEVLKWG